jgi:hypothetical protein
MRNLAICVDPTAFAKAASDSVKTVCSIDKLLPQPEKNTETSKTMDTKTSNFLKRIFQPPMLCVQPLERDMRSKEKTKLWKLYHALRGMRFSPDENLWSGCLRKKDA